MLKVIKSGFFTTVQDIGRFRFRTYGVPVSGAMDAYSSQFANALLGNDKSAAVIEITMTGPKIQFLEPTLIAISGADLSPKLNEIPVQMHAMVQVQRNDILSFGQLKKGYRAYLAIKDGFKCEKVLESRSMYEPITVSSRILEGSTLDYKPYKKYVKQANAHVKYEYSTLENTVLKVHKGPEFEKLALHLQGDLFNTKFSISKLNNRMAYQLEPNLEHNLKPILTSPVLPGTVQLTPSGQLIVLMRDCQTTGGYPRVLQLTEGAINQLSQKRTSEIIRFETLTKN